MTIAIIDGKAGGTKRWITSTFQHEAFCTMSIHNKKVTETFKSTFASVTRNKIIPFTLARTRARITLTGKA